MARQPIDWETIEREYCAGQLSIAEIARQHGISHVAILKKAKKLAWVRNLADRVREAVTAKLVTSAVTASNTREIIDQAAARGVDIVLRHRAGLTRQNEHLIMLQEKLEELIPAMIAIDAIEQAQGIVESMARTRARLIPLERQAFNLSDTSPPEAILTDDDRAILRRHAARYTERSERG